MPRIRPLLLALPLALALVGAARADLGPLEPVADLHRAVHESLGLPEPLIVRLLERGLPDPELPVVGLIARRAAVPVERVVDLRLDGHSFLDISLRLGPGPEIFYVPFDADPGPPYGNAWGYYRKTPRERWRTIRLTDGEIVHLANVRLVADHHHLAPSRVVELHRAGKGYAAIHHELRAAKPGKGPKGGPGAQAKGKKDGAGRKGDKGKAGKKGDGGRGPLG
jgi:hypothetical protein